MCENISLKPLDQGMFGILLDLMTGLTQALKIGYGLLKAGICSRYKHIQQQFVLYRCGSKERVHIITETNDPGTFKNVKECY